MFIMKKFFKLFSMGLIALVFSSCDENVSKVEEAAKQFVEGVIAKDKVTIYEMYPNTRVYSNLLLPDSIKVDGIKVEYDKSDSVYVVKLNEKQSLICRIDSIGVKIYDSYNVLKLDSLCYDLAANTGYPVKKLSDIAKGRAFSDDSDFIIFLSEKYPSAASGNLTAVARYYRWGRRFGNRYMEFDTQISNYGENPVKGEDYFVEISYYRRDTGTSISTTEIVQGVDLAPGESYVYITDHPTLYYYNSTDGPGISREQTIKFKNASTTKMLNTYCSFTGKEYEEFVAQQKEKEKAETEKSEANDSTKAEIVE